MNIEGKTDKQLRRMCVNHWKRMLKLSVSDIKADKEATSDDNCAFCVKYECGVCEGCPVFNSTGEKQCGGTPFMAAANLYCDIQEYKHRKIKTFCKAVQKEIDFLEGLEC